MDLQFLFNDLCEAKIPLKNKEKYGILEPLYGDIYAFSTKIGNARSKHERSQGMWGLVDVVKDEVILPCEYQILTFGNGDKQNSPSTIDFNGQKVVIVRDDTYENYFNLETRIWSLPLRYKRIHTVSGSKKYFVVEEQNDNLLLWQYDIDKIIWDFKTTTIGYNISYKIYTVGGQEIFYSGYYDNCLLINIKNKKTLIRLSDKIKLYSIVGFSDTTIYYENQYYLKLDNQKGYINISNGNIISIPDYHVTSLGHTLYSQDIGSSDIIEYKSKKLWKVRESVDDLNGGFTDGYTDYLNIGSLDYSILYKVTPTSLIPIIPINWHKKLKSAREAISYIFDDYIEELNR